MGIYSIHEIVYTLTNINQPDVKKAGVAKHITTRKTITNNVSQTDMEIVGVAKHITEGKVIFVAYH